MKVEKNAYVAISYDLFDITDANAELVHQVPASEPETIVYGVTPNVLEPLTATIDSLEQGAAFEVELTPEKGFGAYRDELLRSESLPRAMFEEDGKIDEKKIFAGATIYLQTNFGQEVKAVVLAVNGEFVEVKVDLNHPLAGRTLKIVGKIDEVRPATPAEIQAAEAMGQCGCGGDCSCGGGCSADEGCGCEGGCGCN